ncbi:MAG: hypothetical protein NC311_06665 [Muribaculaceae bacterium]|nr:hypothetical protein [Muribaculaceae bacterium]
MNLSMKGMRDFASGKIDESAMQASITTDADISEYENDKQFMDECTALCMPTFIQMMMDEACGDLYDVMDEATKEAFATVQNYLVAQGIISEAATVSISNPKINVVRLNKQAQIARLTTILTLKMGRKANHKAYKKYKLGQKIKKDNMEQLRKIFGAKAERLAKKLWAKTRKNNKVAAVVEDKKPKKAA